MSKLIDKLNKIARRRRARHEVKLKSRGWKYSNNAECGEQGAGPLATADLINLEAEKMRRRLKRAAVLNIRAEKEERMQRLAERREARCRKYL